MLYRFFGMAPFSTEIRLLALETRLFFESRPAFSVSVDVGARHFPDATAFHPTPPQMLADHVEHLGARWQSSTDRRHWTA